MNKKLDPKILQVSKARRSLLFPKLIIANGLAAIIVGLYVEQFTLAPIISMLFLGLFFRIIFTFIQDRHLAKKYYGGNIAEMLDALRELNNFFNSDVEMTSKVPESIPEESSEKEELLGSENVERVTMKVVKTSEAQYGRYMDVEFYEWIEVETPQGEILRFDFKTTQPIKKGVPNDVPVGCLLIPPGLIYESKQLLSRAQFTNPPN